MKKFAAFALAGSSDAYLVLETCAAALTMVPGFPGAPATGAEAATVEWAPEAVTARGGQSPWL